MIGWLLFVLFIVLPLVEILLLIEIGQRIGFLYTLAIVIVTGFLGAFLARVQGVRAWRDVMVAWSEGRVPGVELAAGALFLVGAAFLLTPGVITDAVGFLLMVPVLRRLAARAVIRLFRGRARVHVHIGGRPAGAGMRGGAGSSAPPPAEDEAPRVVRSRRVDDDA